MLLTVLLSFSLVGAAELVWESRSGYNAPGRHHPITFANETHAFLLTGTTDSDQGTSDFYMYSEAADKWTDISRSSPFPGGPRSFGYGVVLNAAQNTKAYVGFGMAPSGRRLSDLYEFDMSTHRWKRLADLPGPGRRHPAVVPVHTGGGRWEIHVGLGDGVVRFQFSNLNDWWSYSVSSNRWRQLQGFPSSRRHHPFFFGLGGSSYAGLGHSDARNGINPYVERDWYQYNTSLPGWKREPSLAGYSTIHDDNSNTYNRRCFSEEVVTTEARVAGTQFSIELPPLAGTDSALSGSLGFVLSGDGSNHGLMDKGEFLAFYPGSKDMMTGPSNDNRQSWWRSLPPHPGRSRWAPGSFVMRGSARAYFTSGMGRTTGGLYNDLWRIDLSPLFRHPTMQDPTVTNCPSSTTTSSTTTSSTTTSSTTLSTSNGEEEVSSAGGAFWYGWAFRIFVVWLLSNTS